MAAWSNTPAGSDFSTTTSSGCPRSSMETIKYKVDYGMVVTVVQQL